ncbi:hypothetical protein MSNKSG1_12947 [Marinobacter santoriniensis NKSG1]|uniref:Uncharacterized protein n=1 Tax=Marinobacter santoriniensis NKSG1 TaxID=1288826 RepID=M7D2M1_9GAMM|nr:hypothetical protein MSNKSG1_12947 [Marinobacter santoriniensis NKSG1]
MAVSRFTDMAYASMLKVDQTSPMPLMGKNFLINPKLSLGVTVQGSQVCQSPIGILFSSGMTGKRTTHRMHPGTECGERQGHRDASLKG